VGKGTLIERLLKQHPNLHYSVSVTTRTPRPGEEEGVNYYFCTREEFVALRESGGLLEWAEYANNFYGTPLKPVQSKLEQGFDVLLEIELAGSRQVVKMWPEAIRIFLKPPSLQELERRLRERAQDSEASIQQRLDQARAELKAIQEFDYVIINDDIDRALKELEVYLYNADAPAD
jgi:guanylate kinase